MAHNITESATFTHLVVSDDRKHSAKFQFGSYATPNYLSVSFDEERWYCVEVTGEDLFALQELLNELPESAFTRPADPVVKPPRWRDGDIVSPAQRVVYIRRDGRWDRYCDGIVSGGDQPDDEISNLVDNAHYSVLRQQNA